MTVPAKVVDDHNRRTEEVTLKLLGYCRANDWSGYDPYDALNSELLKLAPFLDFRFFRIGLTQLLKRSPVNVRPLLLIKPTQNAKALGIFLKALIKLSAAGLVDDESLIGNVGAAILEARSKAVSYWAWGYSF